MTDTSKGYFEGIGADWDRLQQSFFSERVRDVALSVAGVEAGSLAADLGAGTGFVTQALLEKGLSVVAVDQSPAMLDALRKKWPSTEKIDTRVGDAEHLPIDSGLVDYAFANMYLHHVENPPLAIAEMARILKPCGKLVVTDVDTHDFEFLRKEHHDRWLGFEREHVNSWFRDAGLGGVRVDCVGENCCTDSENGTHAALSIFVASGTKPTNDEMGNDAVTVKEHEASAIPAHVTHAVFKHVECAEAVDALSPVMRQLAPGYSDGDQP